MKLSPVRILLVLLFVFIGCFGVAYAAAGMLTALPAPAIGGTCGPSTGSETAFEALAKPSSIGAGPEPSTTNTAGHRQWETFVHQCQTLADRRGLASLAVLVVSLAVAAIGLIWVLRKPKSDGGGTSEANDLTGAPTYAAFGPHDQAALVGAGAVVGAPAAPVAAWPSTPPPVYGAPPAYPAPPYAGAPGGGGYPPQAWPAQPPGEQPPAHSPQSYPPPASPFPTVAPPPVAYPAPAYPAPGDPGQAPTEQSWTTPSAPQYQAPPAPPYSAPPYPAPPDQAPQAYGPIEATAAPPSPPPPDPPQNDAPDHSALGSGAASDDPPGTPGDDSDPPA